MKLRNLNFNRILCVLLVVSVGLAGFFYFQLDRAEKRLADGCIVASETVFVQGSALAKGNYSGALDNLDKHAMTSMRAIDRYFPEHPAATYWLWNLSGYLKERKVRVPADIQRIINRLPDEEPRPEKMLYNVPWD